MQAITAINPTELIDTTKPSIWVKDLCKTYPQNKKQHSFSLGNISFSLPCGAILGLVGENGSGKTTLIKLLLNAIAKDGGHIRFWGKELQDREQEIKSQIGVVLDEGFFYETLSAKQISAVLSRVFPTWDQPLFLNYLDRFSLPLHQPAQEFSKGMQMKLAISTALAHHPRLLLLDEPTSGIDPVCRNEILDIFLEFIQAEENSILFSSHITSDMEKVADYLLYLRQGREVLYGEKDDILFGYVILKCGKEEYARMDPAHIVAARENQFGVEVLVKDKKAMAAAYPNAVIEKVSLEQLMLFYPHALE